MSDQAANLDLSVLPRAYRVAFEDLRMLVLRQEALIHELNHALHGKKSEKLTEELAIVAPLVRATMAAAS